MYVGFFSLARTKLPNYILPAYPPLALLTARFLVRWRAGVAEVPRRLFPTALAGLAAIGIGVMIGLAVAGGVAMPDALTSQTIHGLAHWAWIGLAPLLGAAAGLWFLRRGQRGGVVAAMASAAVAFVGLSALPLQAVEGNKACRALVADAGACRPADEVRLAGLGYFQPSLVFYCRREVGEVYTPDQAVDLLRGPLPAYVFCPAEVGEPLAARGPFHVTGRRRDLYRGIDVVVVSNQ